MAQQNSKSNIVYEFDATNLIYFSAIELSPDSHLALVEMNTMDRHSALRLKTVLDVSHFDRWLTLEGNSKNSLRMVECSYENNFTCSGFNESTTGIRKKFFNRNNKNSLSLK